MKLQETILMWSLVAVGAMLCIILLLILTLIAVWLGSEIIDAVWRAMGTPVTESTPPDLFADVRADSFRSGIHHRHLP